MLLFLDHERQKEHDLERWANSPDVVGDELGNKYRCSFCGAPPGKQCIRADGKFRNYPHQKRRDLAFAYEAEGKSC